MSFGEILIILIMAILILGPDKLPKAIIQTAKILKALKRNIDDAKSSIEKEIRMDELKEEAKKYQNEFSKTNENIRKKLSFEEFDTLKKDILEKTQINTNVQENTPNTQEIPSEEKMEK